MKVVKMLAAACAVAALSACASGTTTVMAPPAAAQGQRFQAVRLEAGQHAIESDAEQVALFERTLRTRLTTAGFGDGDGLRIRYRVIQYDRGSQAMRYLAGPIAGKGSLTIEVVYLDQAGAELSRIHVGGEISGGFFGGGFGEATQRAAEEASQFAVQHFKG